MEVTEQEIRNKTVIYSEIPPKTRSGTRTVPLPEFVVDEIIMHRGVADKRDFIRAPVADRDYILLNQYGRPYNRVYLRKMLVKALEECGISPITWHDLRHTYATYLRTNGFSPKTISRLLGHTNVDTTEDVYIDNRRVVYKSDVMLKLPDMLMPDKEDEKIPTYFVVTDKTIEELMGDVDV